MTYRPIISVIMDVPAADVLHQLSDAAIAVLAVHRVRIVLAMRDFTDVRAERVRALNRAQIPVVAWITRDTTDVVRHYSMHDAGLVRERYTDWQQWSTQQGLHWDAVALEVEPDLHEAVHFSAEPQVNTNVLIQRVADHWHIESATRAFDEVFAHIRRDGLSIEVFEVPFVRDDRVSGSTLARRVMGLPELHGDRSVARLHSSMIRPYGSGVIANYAPEFSAVAIGDLQAHDGHQPLSADELWRDLAHVAACRVAHVYLAGLSLVDMPAVMAQVLSFTWVRAPAPVIDDTQQRVSRMRAGVRALLWAGARPAVLLPLLSQVLLLIRRMLRPHEVQG